MNREIIVAIILFLIIDTPYLLFIAGNYYKTLIENIQKSPLQVKYIGALITYIIMGIAVKYLILDRSKNEREVIINAALVAFIGYGLYDFTNYATFTNWTFEASVIDLLWGMILFMTVSYLTYKINKIIL
jgi:uncharacterized membrane protein